MSDEITPLPYIVAAVGSGGLGLFLREIFDIITKLRNGVSARESKRKTDLVAQRDAADRRAFAAEQRAERETEKRREIAEYAARLRLRLINTGADVAPWPEFDDTEPGRSPEPEGGPSG